MPRRAPLSIDEQLAIFREDLRGLVVTQDWKELAAKANLSYSTVRNFGLEHTKKPHYLTILKLLNAVDLRIGIFSVAAPPQPGEINLRALAREIRKKAR